MSEVMPFRAVHYNSEKIADMSKVVCPPYDVISPKQQNDYHNASEYNFIKILLGKDHPGDTPEENKYARAKRLFDEWRKSGILIKDEKPAIYYYRQEYTVVGERHSRLGFLALMKVQDGKDSRIFPHENTHMSAKQDRLKLWKTLSSNLSPIFVCFSDKEKRIEKIFTKDVNINAPFIDLVDDSGIRHTVWRLVDPALIREISDTLDSQQLFIADGHHRYEVAQELRRQMLEKNPHATGDEPFNYVMTYFANMESKDLKIFPFHRLLKKFRFDMEAMDEFFRIDRIKTKDELNILLAKAGKNEHSFGLYTKEAIYLLRLKNKLLIDKYIPEGSPAYKQLDATILKYFVLDKAGVRSEDIIYTHDMWQATAMVDSGEVEAGFILNPVKIQELKDVALNGEKMPPKTTYFYPKVLSGLTVHHME